MNENGTEYTPETLPAEMRNDAGLVFSKMNEFSEFLGQASGTISQISNVLDKSAKVLGQASGAMSQASNMLNQSSKVLEVTRDIRKIDAMENVMITEITQKYDLYRNVFGAIFTQRGKAIDKYFEVIDKGMSENNTQLIIEGLRYLSETVKSSPFADFKSFKESFNQGALPPI